MISDIKLVHFRNFTQKKIWEISEKNFIIWENWKWKTNILEALSLLGNNTVSNLQIDTLVEKWQNNFYIEYLDDQIGSVGISFDKEKKKKSYIINGKNVTKKKFVENTYKCVIFSPQWMNLFYLSPSLRREFLDSILANSFDEYSELMKDYKKIISSRNKLLKSINEGKSKKSDIIFWDNQFILISEKIYSYRFPLIQYFQSHLDTSREYFNGKIDNISLKYNTKVDPESITKDIAEYLQINLERDIILWKTAIWPHVDDFHVLVDDVSLIDFASRWETKSVIIWLKMLETVFIEKKTGKKPILLIDDLMSELDDNHKEMLTKKIKYYQTFISSISQLEEKFNIIL